VFRAQGLHARSRGPQSGGGGRGTRQHEGRPRVGVTEPNRRKPRHAKSPSIWTRSLRPVWPNLPQTSRAASDAPAGGSERPQFASAVRSSQEAIITVLMGTSGVFMRPPSARCSVRGASAHRMPRPPRAGNHCHATSRVGLATRAGTPSGVLRSGPLRHPGERAQPLGLRRFSRWSMGTSTGWARRRGPLPVPPTACARARGMWRAARRR
jgi:hypothetical protein